MIDLESPALTFSLAMASGMVAQATARHLKIPGIVLLLLVGVALGPDGLGLIRPDVLGEGLSVIVGAAVAVILFEGGMHLEIERLRHQALVIRRLITIGALISGAGAALAARWGMGWPWDVAIPFGSLMIVTGPTVITPLLRRIRIKRNLHTILEAEAVLIDPIGAVIAVMALEIMLSQEIGSAALGLVGIPTRLLFGLAAGAVGGFAISRALASTRLIPEGLESIVTLSLLLALYATCEAVLPETGIMAAPVAGMVVGNAPARPSRALKEFKEQLTVLLIALLFVLLAADVRIAEVTALGWPGLLTVLALMAVVRPLSVAASTAGSSLSLRDRAFIAWLGPRGIVAAAVASFFAEELLREGVEEAFELRALVFLVIAVTVVVEGLGGGLMARLLGVRRAHTGFLIAGANGLGRALASALEARDREVVLIDTDPGEVAAAEAAKLTAVVGNALDDEVLEAADLEGKEGIVSVIPNEGVGILIAEKARREHRVPGAYVAVRPGRLGITERRLSDVGAQPLFGREIDLAGLVVLLSTDRCGLRSYRYDGPSDRLDWKDAGWDKAVIPLVVERRGAVAPVGRDLRLSRGDVVTLLVSVGWDEMPAGFEELARAAHLH